MDPDNRFQTEKIEVTASSSLAIRSSDQKIADALSLPIVTIPVALAAFAGWTPRLGWRRRRASLRRSAAVASSSGTIVAAAARVNSSRIVVGF
jgi:hypothetical protein